MTIPTLPLNDGTTIPQIGLGTWPLKDDDAAPVIVTAIEAGYSITGGGQEAEGEHGQISVDDAAREREA